MSQPTHLMKAPHLDIPFPFGFILKGGGFLCLIFTCLTTGCIQDDSDSLPVPVRSATEALETFQLGFRAARRTGGGGAHGRGARGDSIRRRWTVVGR